MVPWGCRYVGASRDMSSFGLIKLLPTVQTYAWGRPADSSLVFALASDCLSSPPDSTLRYAELWMGAHPRSSATALIVGDTGNLQEEMLSSVLSKDPECILGERVCSAFNGSLPYLFKVLSIGAPLSIQAHPDLELASALNAKDPTHYPDANHKPECSIALSPVELLYGFKSREALLKSIVAVPELFTVLHNVTIEDLEALSEAELRRTVLSGIMTCDASMLRSACTSLQKRLSSESDLDPLDSWVLSLCEKYPDGDPGILCFYVMNFETLDEGEAVFIGPNVAHAYLSGELVECMANSDNVVRAGLTSKFKDVNTLLDMLDYEVGPLAKQGGRDRGSGREEGYVEFSFPVKEYALASVRNTRVSLKPSGVELLFLLEGSAWVSAAGSECTLNPGEGLLVSAEVSEYQLDVSTGTAYRVSVP